MATDKKTARDLQDLVKSFDIVTNIITNGTAYHVYIQEEKNFKRASDALQKHSTSSPNPKATRLRLQKVVDTVKGFSKQLTRDWQRLNEYLLIPFAPARSPLKRVVPPSENSPPKALSPPKKSKLSAPRTSLFDKQEFTGVIKKQQEQLKQLRKDMKGLRKQYCVKRVNEQKRRWKVRLETAKEKALNAQLQFQDAGMDAAYKKKLEERNRYLERAVVKYQVEIHKMKRSGKKMEERLRERIKEVELLNACLLEETAERTPASTSVQTKTRTAYTTPIRKCVYKCLSANVPVEQTGRILMFISEELFTSLQSVPGPSTAAQMSYEMGVLAELHAAELLLSASSATLSWDATAISGGHINECHATLDSGKQVVLQTAVLPGGTTDDYVNHITAVLRSIAHSHACFTGKDETSTLRDLSAVLKTTLTDRAAVNSCVARKLQEVLEQELVVLNCNVHPLDGLAHDARRVLKGFDGRLGITSQIKGSQGRAANLMYCISKMRYKMTGDPHGLRAFLMSKKIQPGVIVRYVGNRLNVLFHLAATIYDLRAALIEYFTKFCSKTTLRLMLLSDLNNPLIVVQLQALGLFSKILTGPWMVQFYQNSSNLHHLEMIPLMSTCVDQLDHIADNPASVMSMTKDIFGVDLADSDTLRHLQEKPLCDQLHDVVANLAQGFSTVLKRQLAPYLPGGKYSKPSQQMLQAAASAPSHNMHSERALGMVDQQFTRAPNATGGFVDGKTKFSLNKTLDWLQSKNLKTQDDLIVFARQQGVRSRKIWAGREKEVLEEVQRRQEEVGRKRDKTARRKKEKEVKAAVAGGEAEVNDLFASHEDAVVLFAKDLLLQKEDCIGQMFKHVWEVEGKDVPYTGTLIGFGGRKNPTIRVEYVDTSEEDCVYSIPLPEFLTDIAMGDVEFL